MQIPLEWIISFIIGIVLTIITILVGIIAALLKYIIGNMPAGII